MGRTRSGTRWRPSLSSSSAGNGGAAKRRQQQGKKASRPSAAVRRKRQDADKNVLRSARQLAPGHLLLVQVARRSSSVASRAAATSKITAVLRFTQPRRSVRLVSSTQELKPAADGPAETSAADAGTAGRPVTRSMTTSSAVVEDDQAGTAGAPFVKVLHPSAGKSSSSSASAIAAARQQQPSANEWQPYTSSVAGDSAAAADASGVCSFCFAPFLATAEASHDARASVSGRPWYHPSFAWSPQQPSTLPAAQQQQHVAHDNGGIRAKLSLPCGHAICDPCATRVFSGGLRERTLLPIKCCGFELDDGIAFALLPAHQHAQFAQAMEEVTATNYMYCPERRCGAFINLDAAATFEPRSSSNSSTAAASSGGAGSTAPTVSSCGACGAEVCARCKSATHPGLSCTQYQRLPEEERADEADRGLLQAAKSHGWQRCPHCAHMVQREYGCHHILCRCGKAFCYRCGGAYPCKNKCSYE